MKKSIQWQGKLKYLLFGVFTVLSLLLLTGAVEYDPSLNSQKPFLNFGRYQLSSWGTTLGGDSGAFGAFVTDTVSGETKLVYTRLYGKPGKGKAVIDNLNKSFSAIP